jgi:hypothetical protein
MEIKTKFDVGDTLVFLTTDTSFMNYSDNDYNKAFVCEGIVESIRFELKHGKQEIVYTVKVRNATRQGHNWIDVNEQWCAPDVVQLGQDVSNRFNVHRLKETVIKKKR